MNKDTYTETHTHSYDVVIPSVAASEAEKACDIFYPIGLKAIL